MSHPLYPQEIPGTHCIRGCVVPRTCPSGCGRSRPPPGFDPQTVLPVASRYTACTILAQTYFCIFILFSVSLYFAIYFLSACQCTVWSTPLTKTPCTIPITVYCGAAVYICLLLLCTALSSTHTGTFQRWYDVTSQEMSVFIFCAHSPSNIVLVHGPLFIWQLSFVTTHWYFALHLGGLAVWAVLVWYISWLEVAPDSCAVQWLFTDMHVLLLQLKVHWQ